VQLQRVQEQLAEMLVRDRDRSISIVTKVVIFCWLCSSFFVGRLVVFCWGF
jgi:hypothetical protein